MNKEIEDIFKDFSVDDLKIPIEFLRYKGNADTYIVYSGLGSSPALASDDKTDFIEDTYDFHIFSKKNYSKIIKEVKNKLIENGFTWVEDSPDLYEDDTGFYSKVITVIKERTC